MEQVPRRTFRSIRTGQLPENLLGISTVSHFRSMRLVHDLYFRAATSTALSVTSSPPLCSAPSARKSRKIFLSPRKRRTFTKFTNRATWPILTVSMIPLLRSCRLSSPSAMRSTRRRSGNIFPLLPELDHYRGGRLTWQSMFIRRDAICSAMMT